MAARRRTRTLNKPGNIKKPGESDKIVGVLYGVSGIGKTKALGSLPGKGLILRPPTEHVDSIAAHHRDRLEEWVINGWSDMDEVNMYMATGGAEEYDWVNADSVIGLQYTGLDDIWRDVIARRPDRAKGPIDQGEYGINMARLMRWVRGMIGVPGFDLWLTTHPAEVEGLVKPDEVLIGPWVQGKNMSQQLVAMCNVVAYYYIDKKGRRIITTKLSDEHFAKDQFDSLSDGRMIVPEEPDLSRWMKAIQASREGKPIPRTTRRRKAKRRG